MIAVYIIQPILESKWNVDDPLDQKKFVYAYIVYALYCAVIYYYLIMPWLSLPGLDLSNINISGLGLKMETVSIGFVSLLLGRRVLLGGN